MVHSSLAWLSRGLPPELVWGLVPRIVGALYVIAFLSLSSQVLGLIGSGGISPVRAQLSAARGHYPGLRRFVRFPTLLWISQHDGFIRALPWLGVAAGLTAVAGGPWTLPALLVCWLLYLSLDVCALMFPWDCLLFEAGVLALFLPAPLLLPSLEASALPVPIVAFAWRMLLIRLMLGFAKLKFIGTKKGDSLYLRGFLAWMPIATPLGALCQRAPAWLLRAAYGFTWIAEVVCPLLGFFRGTPRTLAALGLSGLMAGIWVTGNWGFFNVGYGALCVVFLDTQSSVLDTTLALVTSSPAVLLTHVVMGVLLLGGLLYFPVNSWATHTFIQWPFEDLTWNRPLLRGLIAFYRALAPFRLIHAYGVFPPNSSPPIKVVPVFEGSRDGLTWHGYGYRFMPTTAGSRPPIVAPHHPRIDHLCVYAGSGMCESDYLAGLVGAAKPFGFSPFSHYSWLHRLGERLLEGEPSVLGLLGHNPFPDAPPRYVRVALRALTPSNAEERARGEHWRVRPLGVAFAARERSPLPFAYWLSPPELFHPDLVHYRRKSPALAAMVAAHAAGTLHTEAVCVESDIGAAEVTAFWEAFVPAVAATRGQPDRMDETARTIRERFGEEAVLRFERIAERYVWLLRMPVEPYFYGAREPRIPKQSNFRFHLLLLEVVLDGRAAYERMLQAPEHAAARAALQTDESALHFIGVVRNEIIRYHGRCLRIARRMTNAVEPFLPGILEFKELMTAPKPPDEAWLPVCERSESGEWRCEGFMVDSAR